MGDKIPIRFELSNSVTALLKARDALSLETVELFNKAWKLMLIENPLIPKVIAEFNFGYDKNGKAYFECIVGDETP
jgi:hypothetical protein